MKHGTQNLFDNSTEVGLGRLRDMVAKTAISKTRPVITTDKGVTYVRRKSNNPKLDNALHNECKLVIKTVYDTVSKVYLAHMPTYDTPDIESDYMVSDKSYTDLQKYLDEYKNLINENRDVFMPSDCTDGDINGNQDHVEYFKAKTKYGSIYTFVSAGMTRNTILLTAEFIDKYKVCLIRRVTSYSIESLMWLSTGVITIGKRPNDCETFIHDAGYMKMFNPVTNQYMDMVLKLLRRHIEYRKEHPVSIGYGLDVEYSRTELAIMNKIARPNPSHMLWMHARTTENPDNRIPDDIKDGQLTQRSYRERDISTKEVPLVQFSGSEWKFISRYIQNIDGIYNCEADETIDLRPYLTDQIYGNNLRFVYTSESDDESAELAISFTYFDKYDYVAFDIELVYSQGYRLCKQVEFSNVSRFNLLRSICRVDLVLGVSPDKDIPDSTGFIKKLVPDFLINDSKLFDLMLHIVAIYIVIHDRPKRHRMVRKEIIRSSASFTQASILSKKKQDESFVISRILMTTKDANEYIAKMNQLSDDGTEYNYIIESWRRRGHYRRLPNSDETIWIDPTTCHRRKPLTEKEIVIKL